MNITCSCCRHDNASWRKHCGGCGSGLPGGCASCGSVNTASDRFCGGCARPLRRMSWQTKPSRDVTMPIDVLVDVIDSPA
jgi:hypothetical protein